MPLHDWRCPRCHAEIRDRYQPRTQQAPPICPRGCTLEMECMWSRFTTHFPAFSAEVNGKVEQIDSITKLRQVEAESFKAYEAGKAGDPRFKGARPHVFRQYSQDPGNRTSPIRIEPQPNQTPARMTRSGIPFKVGFGDPSDSS